MDPISIFVILLAAWGIAQRTPGLIGEAAREYRAGRRGETTEAAEALAKRLADAGILPAEGGALRKFLGNHWRDYWHDKDSERQQQRAARPSVDDRSWWKRLIDSAVDRQAAKYRGTRPSMDETGTDNESADTEPAAPGGTARTGDAQPDPSATGDGGGFSTDPHVDDTDDVREPVRVPSQLGDPADPEPIPPQGALEPPSDPPVSGFPEPPVRVLSHLGATPEPGGRTATALLPAPTETTEGNETMASALATRGIPVTGVVSGAAETLSIHNELNAAIDDFRLRLDALQHRMTNLGEQTLTIVQFANGSSVVRRMAQAAEALAACRSAAGRTGQEVLPLLNATRGEFTRRNS